MQDDKWFQVGPPDNPISVRVSSIVLVVKQGSGYAFKTSDGTQHNFTGVTYKEMLRKLDIPAQIL